MILDLQKLSDHDDMFCERLDPLQLQVRVTRDLHVLILQLTSSYGEMIKARCIGTLKYMAPEVMMLKDYNYQCDIFSAGLVLFVMLAGKHPFGDPTKNINGDHGYVPSQAYQLFIDKNTRPKYWHDFKKQYNLNLDLSSQAERLLSKALRFNPSKRISISQISFHSWFADQGVDGQQTIATRLTAQVQELLLKQKKVHLQQLATNDKAVNMNTDPTVTNARFTGTLDEILPISLNEDGGDLYTITDWKIVYEKLCQYIETDLKGSAKYIENSKILLCSTSQPSEVEFSIAMYISPKWNKWNKTNSNNNTDKIFIVIFSRLHGEETDFNQVQDKIVKYGKHNFIFTGLPKWATNEAIAELVCCLMNVL